MGCDHTRLSLDAEQTVISIHAARMGCDCNGHHTRYCLSHFNPRSPNGLRHNNGKWRKVVELFQSTQPEWAATANYVFDLKNAEISIHAARMGCDILEVDAPEKYYLFQSTQPEWAATNEAGSIVENIDNFNPRSPNGLRQK